MCGTENYARRIHTDSKVLAQKTTYSKEWSKSREMTEIEEVANEEVVEVKGHLRGN